MKKVDEVKEQARFLERKRILVSLIAAVLISASFYGWWRKTSPPETGYLVAKTEVAEAAAKKPAEVVVYVSGMVGHPGLIKVQAGGRVLDAVNAAGGLVQGAELSKINLAQPVRDGMQVHVPGRPLEPPAGNSPGYPVLPREKSSSNATNSEGKINVNTAEAEELDKLPGVGPALAARIIEYRKANGPFKDGTELKKVKGLAASKYEKIKDKIAW